jgi:hypothetical protein
MMINVSAAAEMTNVQNTHLDESVDLAGSTTADDLDVASNAAFQLEL